MSGISFPKLIYEHSLTIILIIVNGFSQIYLHTLFIHAITNH